MRSVPVLNNSTPDGVRRHRARRPARSLATKPCSATRAMAWRAFFSSTWSTPSPSTSVCVQAAAPWASTNSPRTVSSMALALDRVRAVVVTGGLDKVFCAGANIQMLAGSSHHHKVNFCKFTNETRNAIEDASRNSGQVWLAAVNGTAAGGGYELALACEEIVLVDDRSSAVSLPEVPMLGVLPGTGGLTRLVDKRHVRPDPAQVVFTNTQH